MSVCMLFGMHTGETRMRNLTATYKRSGLVPRIHGNTRRLLPNTLSYEAIRDVVTFLMNYTEQNGLLLPGESSGV